MAAGPRESTIVKSIHRMLKARGAWRVNYHPSSGRAGVPDILACYRGVFVAFEVKRPGSSYGATRLQLYEISTIEDAGGIAKVVVSKDEAEGWLDYVDQRLDAAEWLNYVDQRLDAGGVQL